MDSSSRNYLRLLLGTGISGILLLILLFLLLSFSMAGGLLAGYVLSYLFVLSNFLVVRNINREDQQTFLKRFLISIVVRFALVLISFALVLVYVKIDQILFTVSFIISYIFLSVIEIIFINKILENRHENR